MSDCDADPAILAWARRFTHNHTRFEDQMRDALPRIVYVEQVADRHGVAGEFALLPWIESQFHPVSGRRGRPAGMWQIMPITARSMGLTVNNRYDGRLNVQAATDAVMKTLRQYFDQFHDWRMADYAYNAGEFSIRKQIERSGAPPEHPVIPRLKVRRVTVQHLTKLLAIACVVREPERFGVTLPSLPTGQRLVSVSVASTTPLTKVAAKAGMSVLEVKAVNAAFRNDVVDRRDTSQLLLPKRHADQYRRTVAGPAPDDPRTTGLGDSPQPLPPLESGGQPPVQASAEHVLPPATPSPAKVHRVKSGESLWLIARRYQTTVHKLERLNALHGGQIKPGQVLKIAASR